jgi:hypothetical protein
MNRKKQVSGPRDIFEREFEKERLARYAGRKPLLDGRVVSSTVFDGVVEDGRIGGEPSDR